MEAPFTAEFFRRLQQLKIHTRKTFLGTRQGTHRSGKKGHGLEFADYRPYSPGDDFRHIDWQLYGRTDRLYVRQFREEQDLNINLLIDSSHSMNFPKTSTKGTSSGNENKFELAKNISLALGFVALTDGDSVNFSILGQEVSPRYVGPKAASRAFSYLKKFSTQNHSSADFTNLVRVAISKQRSPGKCYLISDFLFEVEDFRSGVDLLRAKNLDISIIQILSESELSLEKLSSNLVVDSEDGAEFQLSVNSETSKEYNRLLSAHQKELKSYCDKYEIDFLTVSSSEQLSELVLNRFPKTGLLS